MKFQIAYDTVLKRLKTELPGDLTYHHAGHTEDVIHSCDRIARAEQMSERDIILIKTAAIMHDAGFLVGYQNHEESSVKYAKELLPNLGYGEVEIKTINEMILSTRLPQNPKSKLGKILCDADLDYLGRSDYFTIANGLFLEFKNYGILESEEQWLNVQIKFLENHQYYTQTSKREREPSKQLVLESLRKKLPKD